MSRTFSWQAASVQLESESAATGTLLTMGDILFQVYSVVLLRACPLPE